MDAAAGTGTHRWLPQAVPKISRMACSSSRLSRGGRLREWHRSESPVGADEVDVGRCGCRRGRHDQPPIGTVGHHDRGTAAGHVADACCRSAADQHGRAAGGMIVVGGCTAGGGNEQMCGVPTVAAGIPPMRRSALRVVRYRRRDRPSGHRLALLEASFLLSCGLAPGRAPQILSSSRARTTIQYAGPLTRAGSCSLRRPDRTRRPPYRTLARLRRLCTPRATQLILTIAAWMEHDAPPFTSVLPLPSSFVGAPGPGGRPAFTSTELRPSTVTPAWALILI